MKNLIILFALIGATFSMSSLTQAQSLSCEGLDLVLTPDANDEIRIDPTMVLDSLSNFSRSYGLEIFNSGIAPGNGIVSGVDEVILTNASQYSGPLVIRIHDIITGDECVTLFMNLNPSGGLDCPPTMEITVDSVCIVSFPPRNFTSDPTNSNVNFGAILDPDGNPINSYGDWIWADLSNINNTQLTGIAIDALNGDNCSTQLIIKDTFPPIPICFNQIIVDAAPEPFTIITPNQIDAGSFDNCGDVTFKVFEVDANIDPILPATDSVSLPSMPDTHVIGLEVTDIHGNSDYCLMNVVIIGTGQFICKNSVTHLVSDNCEAYITTDQILEEPFHPFPYQIDIFDQNGSLIANGIDSVPLPDPHLYFSDTLRVDIFDTQLGNSCRVNVLIDDEIKPTAICELDTVYTNPASPFIISVANIDNGSFDNCSIESMQISLVENGTIGPLVDTLLLPTVSDSSYKIFLTVTDESGNNGFCTTDIFVDVTEPVITTTINGTIFEDQNENCVMDAGEPSTNAWNLGTVSFPSNTTNLFQPELDGTYSFAHQHPEGDTLIEVFLLTNMNVTQHCPSIFGFDLRNIAASPTADFAIQTMRINSTPCSQLVVDISTSHLTRCQKSIYTVNYSNYGNEVAEGAQVEVTLDEDLTFINSSIMVSNSNSNTYTFDLGNIEKGNSGSFEIEVEVNCDALLGESHPVIAKISPAEFCEPITPDWSGASVKVDGECIGDSIIFTITNVGNEDMIGALNYIVIEDVILHKQGTFDLLKAAQLRFSAHGKGKTCRLEAEQVPGHPGKSFPSVAVEGCGLKPDGSTSLGFVTQFPQDDADFFRSIHVRENEETTTDFQMMAFPKGIDSRHFIQPNKDIEYLIRFPNNGIAPINQAEITVNLPQELELGTLIPGASSHPYKFEVTESGEIKFVFENLAAAPNNWVYAKYRVAQKANLPNGTMILNEAILSFEDGSTVITNQTFHEVSDNFLTFSSIVNLIKDVSLNISPNPFVENTNFELEGIDNQRFTLNIFDVNGKLVRTETFQNLNYNFQRKGLTKGIYFFNILSEKGIPIVSGKLNPTD